MVFFLFLQWNRSDREKNRRQICKMVFSFFLSVHHIILDYNFVLVQLFIAYVWKKRALSSIFNENFVQLFIT